MSASEKFQIQFDGEHLSAVSGQTIAEVLLANQKLIFRKTPKSIPRGPFCGMGVCYECRMKVDGVPNVRTCTAEATPGCRVETQDDGQIKSPEGKP
jgi:sarcosine oxidase subunit alpha